MLRMFCAPARHSKFPYTHGEEWALLGCISSALKADTSKMSKCCALCLRVLMFPDPEVNPCLFQLQLKASQSCRANLQLCAACRSDWGAVILLSGNRYYSLYGTSFPAFMDSSFTPRFAPWMFSIVENSHAALRISVDYAAFHWLYSVFHPSCLFFSYISAIV